MNDLAMAGSQGIIKLMIMLLNSKTPQNPVLCNPSFKRKNYSEGYLHQTKDKMRSIVTIALPRVLLSEQGVFHSL